MTFVLYLLSLLTTSPNDALVRRLGSEEFATRQSADNLLRQRGWSARSALRRGIAHPDPEVSFRCAGLYEQALSDVIASFGELPEIDAAWYVPGTGYRRGFLWGLPCFYLEPYLNQIGRDGYPWDNYRLATRLWVTDCLKDDVPPWILWAILTEMRRRDEIFLRSAIQHGMGPGLRHQD